MSSTTQLSLTSIRIDGGTQQRAEIDEQHVADIADALKAGATVDPVEVYHDGSEYWLSDGFHRFHAYRHRGLTRIAAVVVKGTRREAILASVKANATHGLKRSNADKRKAVETLLRDDEWRKWSDRKIAEAAAVDHKTVSAVRADMESVGEIPQQKVRVTSDGKTRAVSPKPEATTADKRSEVAAVAEQVKANVAGESKEATDAPPATPTEPDPFDDDYEPAPQPSRHGPLDQEGYPVPDDADLRAIFGIRPEIAQLERTIHEIKRRMVEMHAAGQLSANPDRIEEHAKKLAGLARHGQAYVVCPVCKGDRTCAPQQACHGKGWLTKDEWNRMPEHRQAKHRSAAAANDKEAA